VSASRVRGIFWLGAAAALIVAALVAMTAVLRGDFSDLDARILGTLGAFVLAGGTLTSGLALVDRDDALLGRLAAVLAPVGLAFLLYAIWDVFEGSGDEWRFGWTGILLLVALLVAVTARLFARSPGLRALAGVAGVTAAAASSISVYAVWNQESDDLAQALVAVWILAGLFYLLVPILQRFRTTTLEAGGRVLATLGDVELVATTSSGIDPQLAPGERLVLRRCG
jgi:hypothetical protein